MIMLVQFPLTAKQARSMIQMQRVQPEIKKIQQKYKDDKQKQNEELLKFYQENKINPLAGCLPLIITVPDRHCRVPHVLARRSSDHLPHDRHDSASCTRRSALLGTRHADRGLHEVSQRARIDIRRAPCTSSG